MYQIKKIIHKIKNNIYKAKKRSHLLLFIEKRWIGRIGNEEEARKKKQQQGEEKRKRQWTTTRTEESLVFIYREKVKGILALLP